MKNNTIPSGLRTWFLFHFILDMALALPLVFAPSFVLDFLQFPPVNLLFPRIIGAAMLAIGGNSFVMRNKGPEVYSAMLDLKLIWSGAAILGLAMSVAEMRDPVTIGSLSLFVILFVVWAYYRNRIRV